MTKTSRIEITIVELIAILLVVFGVANVISIFMFEHTMLGIVKLIAEAAIELYIGIGIDWLIKENGRRRCIRAFEKSVETLE